ncbi:MAG: CoA transferase [Actinomycetota bacterium]|jgi:crotonobetainyl-CoA:carnitine CoA-transferase CaiB-like acyl-CoA transferase|nr:CoA transferase [Actinomycetota bacterium]
MSGPLDGVKVVELGLWLAGPACGAILADWGADVVKIEPLDGDPFRGYAYLFGGEVNPPFELDNRGKRSIALDLRAEAGRQVALELLAEADVFVTNYRPGGLERLALDWESVHAHNPRLVYLSLTGYGLEGPERDRAAYDMGAFWARAGVAASLTLEGQQLPYQRGGMGDHMTGLAAAGGVAAALYQRDRTGEGTLVETSMLRLGMYQMGTDLSANVRLGTTTAATPLHAAANPLLTGYQGSDGEWFWLLCLEGDRHWPRVLAALGEPELGDDPRFATIEGRGEHAEYVCGELQRIFRAHSRDEWGEIFDREGVWWARVQHTHELVDDPQAIAARGFVDVPLADGSVAAMVATPVDFAGESAEITEAAPELGQHTELVLLELGRSWEDIASLQEAGVIG